MNEIKNKYKVVLLKQEEYKDIKCKLENGFDKLGGVKNFFSCGDKVLIKPNLLKSALPNEPVTTHPEFIKGLIELFLDYNIIPLIGDSPAMGTTKKVLNSIGIYDYLIENNIKIVDTTTPIIVKKNVRNRKLKFTLFKGYEECDKIVSLAKLKTHGMMLYTGAIKNLFGLIPGGLKPELHFKFTDYDLFADMLTDLYELVAPEFSIIDGINAMEGNGPGSGTSKKMNCIIMSADAAAADLAAVNIIGYKPEEIPVLKSIIKKKIGHSKLEEIEILGNKLNEFKSDDFKLISNTSKVTRFFPGFINYIFKNLLLSKPIVNNKKCIKCGECVDICHGKVVRLDNAKIVFDYKKCIRCYCCQEICPVGAIKVHKPILLKYSDFLIKQL